MTFYFAWVDATDTTFGPAMHVEDEQVFGFEVDHSEGAFPTLRIEVQNPGAGLLNSGRKRWAWLSYDDGSTVTPLFFGRLVGAPDGLSDELVTLSFIARPVDYESDKETVAATLRTLPYWDPIWVNPDDRADPDLVLEARSALWHIDRTTLAVTASDITQGEDGTVALSTSAFRDSVDFRYVRTPLQRIKVNAEVYWEQKASGKIDVSSAIAEAFADAGAPKAGHAASYTGQGLLVDWPASGSGIGDGWTVDSAKPKRVDGTKFRKMGTVANTPDHSKVLFPMWVIEPNTVLRFDATRERAETIEFTVRAGMQPLLTEDGEVDEETITLRTSSVGETIDGSVPIGDRKRRSYLQTDRGSQSIQHLILLARARLLSQARAVEVTADIPFSEALDLSCRKSATISDSRLPGGTATGKVAGYSFGLVGDNGELYGRVILACTVGDGGSLSTTPGTGGYVESGYVSSGYQALTSGQAELPTADTAYDYFATAIDDDGVIFDTFGAAQAVVACTVSNGPTEQYNVLTQTQHVDAAAAMNALNEAYTTVQLQMRAIDGLTFKTDYSITVSDVVVPKTIDLEAA